MTLAGLGGSRGDRQTRVLAELEDRVRMLERQLQSMPSTWAGGGDADTFTVITIEAGGNDVATISNPTSVTLTGVKGGIADGSAVSSVPASAPTAGSTYADGLGVGRLASGTLVWIANKAQTPDGTIHADYNGDVFTGNSCVALSSVSLPLAGDPSTLVTVYIIGTF